MKAKNIAYLVVLLAIIIGVAYWYQSERQAAITSGDQEQDAANQQLVRNLAINFGTKLQMVSLLAPTSTATAAIAENYSGYASPDLLAQWEADPAHAPGRLTSSPWPDHILVDGIMKTGSSTYTVTARVIEITSDSQYADQYSATFTVAQVNGQWLITSWSDGLQR